MSETPETVSLGDYRTFERNPSLHCLLCGQSGRIYVQVGEPDFYAGFEYLATCCNVWWDMPRDPEPVDPSKVVAQ